MNTTKFKIAAYWLLGGMLALPILVAMFSYAVGLIFRPAHVSLGQALRLINESMFSTSFHSESFVANLPIWMSMGGILGMVAYVVRLFLRKRSTV